ncbi:MAG: CDP-alcohol phosphatidyltransferase family protein [Desulfobacterales bacterium]|nr:MAG: CDP-alcohol phosphatidyltransferase family protein [Desulfobacterales bacterium]
MNIIGKLKFWLLHLNEVLTKSREKKYLPVTESDYPIKNERYMAFENRVGSIFPGFIEPNHLTFLRILICIILLISVSKLSYLAILSMIIIGGFSDFLDGALARAQGKKTKLGVMLDPLADKLLVFSAFFILTVRGDIRPAYILCMALCEIHVFVIPMLSYVYQWKKGREYEPPEEVTNHIEPVLFGRVKVHFYVYAVLLIIIGRMINMHTMIAFGDSFLIMGISAAVIALFQYMFRWARNPY